METTFVFDVTWGLLAEVWGLVFFCNLAACFSCFFYYYYFLKNCPLSHRFSCFLIAHCWVGVGLVEASEELVLSADRY